MSDLLERELARELAPVAAPRTLAIRLGLAPAKRWEFPRLALAVAAAVVLVIGGGYAASRTALDLRREAGLDFPLRPVEGTQPAGARLLSCDGGAGVRSQVNAGHATVLLAHAGSETPPRTLAQSPEAGCHLCHSL